MSDEEERRLIVEAKAGDRSAAIEVMKRHMRLGIGKCSGDRWCPTCHDLIEWAIDFFLKGGRVFEADRPVVGSTCWGIVHGEGLTPLGKERVAKLKRDLPDVRLLLEMLNSMKLMKEHEARSFP